MSLNAHTVRFIPKKLPHFHSCNVMKRIAFVRGSEGHSVKMHFSISNCFTGCRIWVVVAFFADLRVDAALCIDPSFDELFRGTVIPTVRFATICM